MKKENKYILYTYLLFFMLFCITGGALAIFGEGYIFGALQMLCSWAPTIVLVILFKQLVINKNKKEFVKQLFSEKVNMPLLLGVIVSQITIFVIALYFVSIILDCNMMDMVDLSLKNVLWGFLYNLFLGPMGENFGWKGYLFTVFVEKYGKRKAIILLGLVQAFWHFPLWLASGYTGWSLVIYSVAFSLALSAANIIMCICYEKNHNLLMPIMVHQMFNFTVGCLYSGELLCMLSIISICYTIVAVIIWRLYEKE